MGFLPTASTVTLTAKLTPTGRRKLIMTSNNLITSFSLGDSDANYLASLPLTTGQVPSNSGNIGSNGSLSNSVGANVTLKSLLVLNSSGLTKKAVESASSGVTLDFALNGQVTVSGTGMTQSVVLRTNGNTDPLVNLYYSFGLPLTSTDDVKFTGTTSQYGGFSGTALSGLATTKILAVSINSGLVGEALDGKSVYLQLPTTSTTYNIYSTYQNTGLPLSVQDANYNDIAANTRFLGPNIAFLVSDEIKKPNGGDTSLSWATGYGSVKPFSVNGKKLYNFITDSNVSESADTIVGVAYLDKGFLVITHPTIVNAIGPSSSGAVITVNSVSSSVAQNVTCIANRGEFGSSTNSTWRVGDIPRISEIGLYDSDGDLIAIAKMDRQIQKNVNEFIALGIKIAL
jgi:hypothetical protein